jgi:hypothetical protein
LTLLPGHDCHVSATAVDHDGRSSKYEGIRLADVVRDAGAPVGDAVRGSAARAYILVSAADGYAAFFTLGELDTALWPSLAVETGCSRRPSASLMTYL